ncbi:MAG TPA: flagellar motor switch protein FliN [Acidimicrobiales bacterium]|nr:flagellar motor switch protein FliN [Acidimicrobiales bacterium]
MSVDTDTNALSAAVEETAGLVAGDLALGATGAAYNPWSPEAPTGPAAASGARAWSAQLLGPLGPCGEISIILAPQASVPGEGRIASALATAIAPLGPVCSADHIGELQRCEAQTLVQGRDCELAVAVPILTAQEEIGLVVVAVSGAQPTAELPHLDPSPGPAAGPRSIAALGDVEMTVSVELGRTKIPIKDLLGIHNGAVVQLDRSVASPVDIFVHGTLIARGEVVVVDECFAVRVTELLTGD